MTTDVAIREPAQPPPLIQMIESRRDAIAEVLPEGMSVNRFVKVAVVAVTKNPALLDCTPISVLTAIMDAAELGLEPTGSLSRAWLVPQRVNVAKKGQAPKYELQAQLRIGYMGLGDLARNSGVISKMETRLVFKGDYFKARYGTDPGIDHEPTFDTDDPADIEKAYAVAYFKDGSIQMDVMKKSTIDGIRARAPGNNSGPWSTDYGEMARKTVARRLAKSLPLTAEAQAAVQRDIERDSDEPRAVTGGRTAELKRQLAARVGQPATDAAGDEIEAEMEEVLDDAAAAQDEATLVAEEVADAVCGNVAGDGLMEGTVCLQPAGHPGPHKALSGSWPA